MDVQSFTNISLLPHDPSIVIKDITQKITYIHSMHKFLDIFKEALITFEQKQFHCFDAQVGETLCQIRAYKIYTLAALTPVDLQKTIKNLELAKQSLIIADNDYQIFLKQHKSQRPEHIRDAISLENFFNQINCQFPISTDELFIFLSYFLCKYHILDNDHIPQAINYEQIATELNLSKTYAKKIGHFYQKKLSILSSHFIFKLLEELPGKEDLKLILPKLYLTSDEERMALPCFAVTEIIFLHMIESEAFIILDADIQSIKTKEKKVFLFQGSQKQGSFEFVANVPSDNTPALICYGASESYHANKETLSINLSTTLPLLTLLLANNAAHPQYSGTKLQAFRENPYQTLLNEDQNLTQIEKYALTQLSFELMRLKHLAKKLGCTNDNPSLFVLKHIFCSSTDAYSSMDTSVLNHTSHSLELSVRN